MHAFGKSGQHSPVPKPSVHHAFSVYESGRLPMYARYRPKMSERVMSGKVPILPSEAEPKCTFMRFDPLYRWSDTTRLRKEQLAEAEEQHAK
jgi:hypothetical protein